MVTGGNHGNVGIRCRALYSVLKISVLCYMLAVGEPIVVFIIGEHNGVFSIVILGSVSPSATPGRTERFSFVGGGEDIGTILSEGKRFFSPVVPFQSQVIGSEVQHISGIPGGNAGGGVAVNTQRV